MRHFESKLQQSCVSWFKIQYPKIAPLLFAVPNGGKRNAREASIMKSEGVTAGVADLILLLPNKKHNAMCIEMKYGNGKQSPLQKQWAEIAQANGAKYTIIRSIEQFIQEVTEYINN